MTVSWLNHLTLAANDKAVKQTSPRWATYTWAVGSGGETMQLCTGVNGRRMTSVAAFFVFSLPYVLKQKQKQSE